MTDRRDHRWAKLALRRCLSSCFVLAAIELAFDPADVPRLRRWFR